MLYYSKTTGGFYDSAIHGDSMPPDVQAITDEEHAALMLGQSAGKEIAADATGRPVLQDRPAPTPDQVAAAMSAAAQERLDTFAATRRYDNVNSASKYLTLTDEQIAAMPADDQPTVTRYRTECRYLVGATAQTWAAMERIQGQVQAGTRPMPASFADVEPELPALEWPQ